MVIHRLTALSFPSVMFQIHSGSTSCAFPAPFLCLLSAMYLVESFSRTLAIVLCTPKWAADAPPCIFLYTRIAYNFTLALLIGYFLQWVRCPLSPHRFWGFDFLVTLPCRSWSDFLSFNFKRGLALLSSCRIFLTFLAVYSLSCWWWQLLYQLCPCGLFTFSQC